MSVAPLFGDAIQRFITFGKRNFEVDFTAFDVETLEQYSDYLQRAVPVDMIFTPGGFSFEQKMRLVQLASFGAMLGDARVEEAENDAIWHDIMDRKAAWTVLELLDVITVTPAYWSLRHVLFYE